MAKRKGVPRKRSAAPGRGRSGRGRSGKRRSKVKTARKGTTKGRSLSKRTRSSTRAGAKQARPAKPRTTKNRPQRPKKADQPAGKSPRLNRERRILQDVVPSPPSSLNMDRRSSAARSGRAALENSLSEHAGMPELTGGDVDGDWENAYFSGE